MVKSIEGKTIDVEADDISEMENDNDADLSSIFAEFGGAPDDKAHKMKIYRVIPDKAEMAWLFDCVPSELPIHNRLRDEYKGGRFEIRIYELRQGVYKLKKKPHIVIEAPQKVDNPQSSDIATVLRELRESQQRQFEQLTAVLTKASGTPDLPTNPLALIRDLAGVMRDIMPAPAPQSSMKDMIESMLALKELMPDSRGGGDTNWLDVFSKALESPMLTNILEGAAQGAKQRVQQLPGPGQAAKPAQTEQPKQTEAEMRNLIIKQYVGSLIARAQNQQDAGFVAELILNDAKIYNIPLDVIRNEMLSTAALDKLMIDNPDAAPYRSWFGEVQVEVERLINEDAAPA